jgi:hypothetical protein
VVLLERLWQGVKDRWADHHAMGMADTEMPVWDEVTLQLAKAVGRGQFTINLDPPTDVKDGFDVAVWLAELRSYFPFIQVNLSPIFTATVIDDSYSSRWRQLLLRLDHPLIGTRYAVVSVVVFARRFLACSAR